MVADLCDLGTELKGLLNMQIWVLGETKSRQNYQNTISSSAACLGLCIISGE